VYSARLAASRALKLTVLLLPFGAGTLSAATSSAVRLFLLRS
jgi:hypothetical protein